ncbi:MAG: helix-turn-helix transcriptional regulator [Oscillibacter sp.]|nr:helix-turn-helix transcriptional regulator [Oscillibacter sp.]
MGRLYEQRIDHDKSQKEIAEVLEITRQQYQLYESGKRELPLHHLRTLCPYYQVSADYILDLPKGLTWPR